MQEKKDDYVSLRRKFDYRNGKDSSSIAIELYKKCFLLSMQMKNTANSVVFYFYYPYANIQQRQRSILDVRQGKEQRLKPCSSFFFVFIDYCFGPLMSRIYDYCSVDFYNSRSFLLCFLLFLFFLFKCFINKTI